MHPYSVRRKLCKKSQAWRVYHDFRIPESLASYRKDASECKSAIYSFTAHYENMLVSIDNIGAFYRYANNKFCTKCFWSVRSNDQIVELLGKIYRSSRHPSCRQWHGFLWLCRPDQTIIHESLERHMGRIRHRAGYTYMVVSRSEMLNE
jgi:hypothetical protein